MNEELFMSAALPDGDYAIVEILGHRTLIGRIGEVERFGTKMLQVEPIFQGRLLPAVLHGGGSIYSLTPCTREVAGAKGPTQAWQLPASVASTLPQDLLAAPAAGRDDPADEDDDHDGDDGWRP